MQKNILITRPIKQSQEIKEYLQKNDFDVFIEPIFEILELPINLEIASDKNISAIIVTSGNAANAVFNSVEKFGLEKNIKIFAVGKKTAEIFIKAGFTNVNYAKENSAISLKDLILQNCQNIDKQKDVLLYFCGEFISLDFQEEFAKYDIKLEKIVSYKVIELESFSNQFLQRIKQSHFDFILLYSKNSAKSFFKLLKKHDLLDLIEDSKILCLSKSILDFVDNSGFNNTSTFDEITILKKFYE